MFCMFTTSWCSDLAHASTANCFSAAIAAGAERLHFQLQVACGCTQPET